MGDRVVVIVAGGKGERMGGDMPKQFLPLCGRPVLMRTVERFAESLLGVDLIVVLPANQIEYWSELCRLHDFSIPHRVVAGGDSRYSSVKNGLSLVGREGVVGIHDGVRPFVSSEVIERSFALAEEGECVVPVIELIDSIRRVADDCNFSVPRSEFRMVQTPQTFPASLIQDAYLQDFDSSFTDDASVVESLGRDICLIEGNRENIKITTPLDLLIGEALLRDL